MIGKESSLLSIWMKKNLSIEKKDEKDFDRGGKIVMHEIVIKLFEDATAAPSTWVKRILTV